MAKYIDLVSYNLVPETFAVTVTGGTQFTLPIEPNLLTTAFGVFVIDAQLASGESITATSWSLSGSNVPQITVTFSSGAVSRPVKVVVLYKN